jgi:hypothetical protein
MEPDHTRWKALPVSSDTFQEYDPPPFLKYAFKSGIPENDFRDKLLYLYSP